MKKIILSLILITLGILFRTIWHLGPNIEFVTAAAILGAIYLGGRYTMLIPLIIMVISDKIIGNTNIYLFTWSAYLLIGITSVILNKLKVSNSKLILGTGLGIGAAVFFFIFTNFGVWALDYWGMYSRDLNGLTKCYLMGLPFLKYNLIGNLIFIPLSIFIIEKARVFLLKVNLKPKFLC